MANSKPPVFVESNLGVASQTELHTQVAIWREARERLAKATADEFEARQTIVTKWFPEFVEGTNTGALREANLKCGMPMSRTVNQEECTLAFEWAEKEDTPPRLRLRELLNRTFRTKFELCIGVWRDLTDAERLKLADIVTEKPGTPSLRWEPKS